ncbi:HAD family hydrolase [Thermopolyspora sp. NPDC052614]|uniref:HAD family hydrolase n=1 Tax=Thermopolyspora sp. NPDC052614 TaxID=3155682 RepID=UPI003418D5D2
MIRAVAFDIGETLVCDDRHWSSWADWLGVPRHTLSALVGAMVAQGRDNAEAIRLLRPGIDLAAEYEAREIAGRGERLEESDLYPDVRPALTALHDLGLRVLVAGNQTVRAAQLLRELNLPAEAIATSGEWRTAKPAPAFFARVVELSGVAPHQIVYVGDHPANDIIPAKAAGMHAALIRRGPWGYLWADDPVGAAADWRIDSLAELPALLEQHRGEAG